MILLACALLILSILFFEGDTSDVRDYFKDEKGKCTSEDYNYFKK